jgi:hypothetical protein
VSAAPNLEPAGERDYAAEMRALINAETATGPYASTVVAAHIVRKLRATDPDLLHGWLDAQATDFVRQAINERDRSTRTYARTAGRRSAFGDDARRHEAGQGDALVRWLSVPFPVEDGSRKRLADLTAADLDFVADRYEQRAAENAMTAAFLRALRRKVGRKTVGDCFDDAQLTAMWRSISGGNS